MTSLNSDAFEFCSAISNLWLLETICDRSADIEMDDDQLADTRQRVRAALNDITTLCVASGLEERIGPEVDRFEISLDIEPLRKSAGRCDHLRERILDELKTKLYFSVPSAYKLVFDQEHPFGPKVSNKFSKSVRDAKEAAKCLALSQPTACVFHLMRAMESAVKRLAKRLGIAVTPQTTWRQLTASMDSKIKLMPQSTTIEKKRKNDWEDARINLHHLGSVLRNNTMHPSSVFTQSEAAHISNATRVAMEALSEL